MYMCVVGWTWGRDSFLRARDFEPQQGHVLDPPWSNPAKPIACRQSISIVNPLRDQKAGKSARCPSCDGPRQVLPQHSPPMGRGAKPQQVATPARSLDCTDFLLAYISSVPSQCWACICLHGIGLLSAACIAKRSSEIFATVSTVVFTDYATVPCSSSDLQALFRLIPPGLSD